VEIGRTTLDLKSPLQPHSTTGLAPWKTQTMSLGLHTTTSCMNGMHRCSQNHADADFSTDTFGSPSDTSLLALSMLQYVPRCIREFLVDHVPSEGLRHIRYTAKVTTSVARELVASKSAALLQGKGSRDIMSLLGESICGVRARGTSRLI
jgi:hypothetical protein